MAMAPAGLPLSTGSSSYLQGWVTSNIHDPKDRVKLRANIVLFSLKILWLNKAYSFNESVFELNTFPMGAEFRVLVTAAAIATLLCNESVSLLGQSQRTTGRARA